MIEQIANALERQDYRTAASLLKKLLKQEPDHPWGRLYLARLYEETGKLDLAEDIYRHLLRNAINSKIAALARSGLERLETREKQRLKQAIAQANSQPENAKSAVLIIEPVTGENRRQIAQKFAKIVGLDPYTAQMQLPSLHWRFHRTGPLGELQVYGQELREAGIPAFWASLEEIEQINVFTVKYFQAISPQPTVICQNESGQVGTIGFDWSEVAQRVEGRLPIFESVVVLDARGRQQRQEQIQDYVQVYDLHLPNRQCLLRLCNINYQFDEDLALTADLRQELSNRLKWNHLISLLSSQLKQTPVWSDFTTFGEMALQQAKILVNPTELLGGITSHIHISRRAETDWDPAFQLYSALVFLKTRQHP